MDKRMKPKYSMSSRVNIVNNAKHRKKRTPLMPDGSIPPSYKPLDAVSVRFGKRLRELRTSRGLTQLELSIRSGLDRGFISEMENGGKEPTISTQELLALSFNITIAELVKGV